MYSIYINDDHYYAHTTHEAKNIVYEKAFRKGLPKESILVFLTWTFYDDTAEFTKIWDIYGEKGV